jgi:hypothetical protein
MTQVPGHFTHFKCSTPHYTVTYNLNVQMNLLHPVLKKLHTNSVAVPNWVVFLKPKPSVKWNNAEFTNASCFTLPLMCSAHFILSGMILLALTTSNNFVQFVLAKIPGESAWGVPLRLSWCWLLLWSLQFTRTQLLWILDFCLGTCYLLQEVLLHYLLFLFVLYTVSTELCTVQHTHTVIWQFSSELSNNWGTCLP